MIFGEFIMLGIGAVIIAAADKISEDYGFEKVRRFIKVLIPVMVVGLAIYFLAVNPILRWIGL